MPAAAVEFFKEVDLAEVTRPTHYRDNLATLTFRLGDGPRVERDATLVAFGTIHIGRDAHTTVLQTGVAPKNRCVRSELRLGVEPFAFSFAH